MMFSKDDYFICRDNEDTACARQLSVKSNNVRRSEIVAGQNFCTIESEIVFFRFGNETDRPGAVLAVN